MQRIELQLMSRNIEELFSLASAVQGSGLVSAMVRAIGATLEHRSQVETARNQFAVTRPEEVPPDVHLPWEPLPEPARRGTAEGYDAYLIPLYDYYAGALTGLRTGNHVGQNTFITFNYDTILEQGLHACGSAIDYGVSARNLAVDPQATLYDAASHGTSTQVLKLHGSVNWAYPRKRGGRPTAYQDYAAVTAASLEPLLVPPTWQKMTHKVLLGVWESAVKALTSATRIVVIGFSLPPTDVHFKYLIAGGLRENISLREIWFVNPAVADLRERISQVLRPDLRGTGVLRELAAPLGNAIRGHELLPAIGRPPPGWLYVH